MYVLGCSKRNRTHFCYKIFEILFNNVKKPSCSLKLFQQVGFFSFSNRQQNRHQISVSKWGCLKKHVSGHIRRTGNFFKNRGFVEWPSHCEACLPIVLWAVFAKIFTRHWAYVGGYVIKFGLNVLKTPARSDHNLTRDLLFLIPSFWNRYLMSISPTKWKNW